MLHVASWSHLGEFSSNQAHELLSYKGRHMTPVEVFLVGAPSGALRTLPIQDEDLEFSE